MHYRIAWVVSCQEQAFLIVPELLFSVLETHQSRLGGHPDLLGFAFIASSSLESSVMRKCGQVIFLFNDPPQQKGQKAIPLPLRFVSREVMH